MPNPEAPGTSYDIEVLRPLDWLAMTGAEEGGTIAFSLPELNLFGEAMWLQLSLVRRSSRASAVLSWLR